MNAMYVVILCIRSLEYIVPSMSELKWLEPMIICECFEPCFLAFAGRIEANNFRNFDPKR